MFVAFARTQFRILSSLWCSGFKRLSRSVVEGTGGHVVPSLGSRAGPFEPGGFYRLIVQPRPRPSAVMSQHSRRQINDLVLQQMSSVVKTVCDGRTKSTNIAVSTRLCRSFRCWAEHRRSVEHLHLLWDFHIYRGLFVKGGVQSVQVFFALFFSTQSNTL